MNSVSRLSLIGVLTISFTAKAGTDWMEPISASDQQSVRNITIHAFSDWSPAEKSPTVSVNPIWPLRDVNPVLLQRFGTPTLLEIESGNSFKVVDSHEALDISRSDLSNSDEVLAPIDGVAKVIRQNNDYTTGVAILNRKTGLVFALLHVVPSEIFKQGSPIYVQQGTSIGKLAQVTTMRESVREKYRHTHLLVADLGSGLLINPLKFYRHIYSDRVAPVIESATAVRNGTGVELRLAAYDRDERSSLPFELHSLAFDIQTEEGILLSVPRCSLDQIVNRSSGIDLSVKGIFDLNSMSRFNVTEMGDNGEYRSNAANPDKRFIYALDRIRNSSGFCAVTPEPLTIPPSTKRLLLRVVAWDIHGNRTDQAFTIPIQ